MILDEQYHLLWLKVGFTLPAEDALICLKVRSKKFIFVHPKLKITPKNSNKKSHLTHCMWPMCVARQFAYLMFGDNKLKVREFGF